MNITNRETHHVLQGTGPWLRLREGFLTASEAPAALGVSKYVTRTELLRQKFTSFAKEHSPATLGKFAAGHAAEAAARPLAEKIADGELFPVTMTAEVDGLPLLASLDGLTMDDEIAWETKLWNEELAADVRAGTLAAHYTVQMDQVLLVSGARRCLFSCTDGTPERFVSCWYEASAERFAELVNGWRQFRADLAAYVPTEAEPLAPIGKAPETLPALLIEVSGQVTASNLTAWKARALAMIKLVNDELKTDSDFADAEKAVKWCEDVEFRLKAAKEHALSQTESIDALFKAIDDIAAEARAKRLGLQKLVDRRKVEVREGAIQAARRAFLLHVDVVNAEIAPARSAPTSPDFAGAIKGKRSVAGMQDALDTLLAKAKIGADETGRKVRANQAAFKAQAEGFEFLFADVSGLVHKAPEDLAATIQARIAAHKQEQAEKEVAAQQAKQRAMDEMAARIVADDECKTTLRAAANAGWVVDATFEPAAVVARSAPAETPTLKLGAINERLGYTVTAELLGRLGFVAHCDRSAKLYRESDFRAICSALAKHTMNVCAAVTEAA